MEPRLCYVAVMKGDAWTLGIVKEGERGYYQTDYPTVPTNNEAEDWANGLNDRLGLGRKEVLVMVLQSMRED